MRVSWHLFWKMLRRQRQIRMYMHQCVDAVLFALGLWLAHEVRSISTHLWPQFQLAQIESFSEYLWLWVAILPLAPLVLQAQGFYNRPILFSRRETAWVLGKSAAILTLATVSLLFLKKEELARSVIILFGAFGFGMVLLKEELVRRWAATELGQEQLRRRLVVIGEPDETGKVVDELAEKIGGGVEVLARLTFDEASPEKILEMLHDRSANGIILSAGHVYFDQVERIIETCELEGVEVWLLADFLRTKVSQTSVDDFLGRPTLVFRSTPEASWQGVIKQVIDFLGAALALVVLFIPMILVGILIRYSSPGPVFFLQKRSGLNGRPFTMLKFRTMVSNAEQRKSRVGGVQRDGRAGLQGRLGSKDHERGQVVAQIQRR